MSDQELLEKLMRIAKYASPPIAPTAFTCPCGETTEYYVSYDHGDGLALVPPACSRCGRAIKVKEGAR